MVRVESARPMSQVLDAPDERVARPRDRLRWFRGFQFHAQLPPPTTVLRIGRWLRACCIVAIWLVCAIVLARLLYSWTFDEPRITILPFSDPAAPDGRQDLGATVSDALAAQLGTIESVHTTRNIWHGAETVQHLGLSGQHAFDTLGNIQAGSVTLPAGKVLSAIKELWPHVKTRRVLSGSVLRFGSVVQVTARLEEDGNVVQQWSVDRPVDGPPEPVVRDLVSDLGYQIAWKIEDQIGTRTWEGLKHLTIGLQRLTDYTRHQTEQGYQEARDNLTALAAEDPNYAVAQYNLGRLYYLRAFYRDDSSTLKASVSSVDSYAEGEARRSFQSAIDEGGGTEYEALGHFGLAMMDVDRDRLEQQPGNKCQSTGERVKTAESNFKQAIELAPQSYIVHAAYAVFLDMTCRPKEAINAWEAAKPLPEAQPDAIDREIQKLRTAK